MVPIPPSITNILPMILTLLFHFSRWIWGNVPNSLVISQKGKSQNGCFKKTKHAKFPEKRTFFTPDTHTYMCASGGKIIYNNNNYVFYSRIKRYNF